MERKLFMRFWAGLAALAVVGGICTALVGEDAKTGGKSEEKKDGSLLSKIRRNHQVDSSADRLNNSFLLVRSPDGRGSAFMTRLWDQPVIVTNAHVYLEMKEPEVVDINGKVYKIKEVLGSKSRDLVILSYEDPDPDAEMLSAAGDTKKPLYFLSMAGVINILLNLFFVIVCHLAAAGVALASIISQYISAALVILSLRRSGSVVRLERSMLRIEPHKARQVLSLSIPAGLQNAIFAIANLFIQAGVNSFDELMVEGNAAAANADALVYDVMAAIYTACSSFMSQNYGAGKRKRIIHSYFISMVFSFGIALVMSALLVIFGRQFLGIFTNVEEVAQAGMIRLRIMGCSYAFSAFMDCTIAANRGLGKSFVPTVIVIMGSCVFRIIWVYTVFAYFHTIESLYLLYIVSWAITAAAEMICLRRVYREQMQKLPPDIDGVKAAA